MNRRNFLRATVGCAVAMPVAATAVSPAYAYADWNDPDNWLPATTITTFLFYKKNDSSGQWEVFEEKQFRDEVTL